MDDRIDRYKLLRLIGTGGCTAVYAAEQEEPVRLQVALKLLQSGFDVPHFVARFVANRDALERMNHPNIVKLLDIGTTDDGWPYFIMELVRGTDIIQYCDRNNLRIERRLELFVPVCKAIYHAHTEGIVHGFIKPADIIVKLRDAVPVPKIIDFGLADKALFGELDQLMVTPIFMSPEQVGMTGLDIDTRTDIYSLGVLLYELLTDKFPLEEELRQADGNWQRVIGEKEPLRPSVRLGRLSVGELTMVARRRQADPAKLFQQMRGDLDRIVMKCLEKDPRHRYETASDLASDIERLLCC